MASKPLLYVAGSLRSDIPGYIANCSRMIKFAEAVRREGFAVYVPCLDFLQGIVMGDMQFHDYFDNSFAVLERCDGLILTPGYEGSVGTQKEIIKTKMLCKPVFESIERAKNYYKI